MFSGRKNNRLLAFLEQFSQKRNDCLICRVINGGCRDSNLHQTVTPHSNRLAGGFGLYFNPQQGIFTLLIYAAHQRHFAISPYF